MKNHVEALTRIIKSRRSVQPSMFNERVIPDEWVNLLLQNASFAPTHKKTEPWRFIVFKGDSLKELSDYSSQWYKENTPNYSELKFEKTRMKALLSSHVVAIVMQRHESEVPEWEEVASVACAVQNLWLSATAMGLAGYWSSPGYAVNGQEFLKLDTNQRCLGLFYLGFAKADIPEKSYYPDPSNKVEWR